MVFGETVNINVTATFFCQQFVNYFGDSLLGDDVAVLNRGARHPCHLHVAHHVCEGQSQVGAMDGDSRASLRGSSHWGHL